MKTPDLKGYDKLKTAYTHFGLQVTTDKSLPYADRCSILRHYLFKYSKPDKIELCTSINVNLGLINSMEQLCDDRLQYFVLSSFNFVLKLQDRLSLEDNYLLYQYMTQCFMGKDTVDTLKAVRKEQLKPKSRLILP